MAGVAESLGSGGLSAAAFTSRMSKPEELTRPPSKVGASLFKMQILSTAALTAGVTGSIFGATRDTETTSGTVASTLGYGTLGLATGAIGNGIYSARTVSKLAAA